MFCCRWAKNVEYKTYIVHESIHVLIESKRRIPLFFASIELPAMTRRKPVVCSVAMRSVPYSMRQCVSRISLAECRYFRLDATAESDAIEKKQETQTINPARVSMLLFSLDQLNFVPSFLGRCLILSSRVFNVCIL